MSARSKAAIAAGAGLGATVLFAPAADAATLTVTSLADDGSPGTLRSAVEAANAAAGADTIVFQSGLSGTIQLNDSDGAIEVYNESLTIDGPGANALTIKGDGDERIFTLYNFNDPNQQVTFDGLRLTGGDATGNEGDSSGSGGAISSDDDGSPAPAVTIANSVLTGNHASDSGGAFYTFYSATTLLNSTITNNTADDDGGGVYLEDANQFSNLPQSLVIQNSTISNNRADGAGGGVYSSNGYGGATITGSTITNNISQDRGGGLYFTDQHGSVTVQGTQINGNESLNDEAGGAYVTNNDGNVTFQGTAISGNVAGSDAGGLEVYDNTGAVTVSDSTLAGNRAGGYGGGGTFYDNGGQVTISGTTIANNRATDGGGGASLWGNDGLVLVQNTTVTGNRADSDNDGDGYGGGFNSYNRAGGTQDTDRIIRNSTIVGNRTDSPDGGGGVYAYLFDNNAGAPDVLQLRSTIVANNSAPAAPSEADLGFNVGGPPTGTFDAGFSLIRTPGTPPLTESPAGSNIFGQDPQLGPLADNGGLTQTLLPALTSSAIDAGVANGLTTDQRGLSRTDELSSVPNKPGSDGTDIGAVEIQTASCQGSFVPSKTGTDNGETITGTDGSDALLALGGDDTASGLKANDCVDGGEGNDKLSGDEGKDLVVGGKGDDRADGSKGKDKVKGNDGRDVIIGGPGKDKLKGNGGLDKIKAIDDTKDKVNCGAGNKDKAKVDAIDKVKKNCEIVKVAKK
jgi:hypothetical protein